MKNYSYFFTPICIQTFSHVTWQFFPLKANLFPCTIDAGHVVYLTSGMWVEVSSICLQRNRLRELAASVMRRICTQWLLPLWSGSQNKHTWGTIEPSLHNFECGNKCHCRIPLSSELVCRHAAIGD